MPELPEVNVFKNYFNGTSLDQRIAEVNIFDEAIIKEGNGEEIVDKLLNRSFIGSTRRGKYLFTHLDNGDHLLFHFGMTGDFKYYSDISDRPKYERFSLHFENGFFLGFDCLRKFGRIVYIEDLDGYIDRIGLGHDALIIEESTFLELAKGRKTSLKGFLLNQKLIAGIGNLYADEICYNTRIHPGSKLNAIPRKKLIEVYQAMKTILQSAIEYSLHYKDDDNKIFWKWRTKDGDENGAAQIETIAGRTTFFIKKYQKIYL